MGRNPTPTRRQAYEECLGPGPGHCNISPTSKYRFRRDVQQQEERQTGEEPFKFSSLTAAAKKGVNVLADRLDIAHKGFNSAIAGAASAAEVASRTPHIPGIPYKGILRPMPMW